MNITNVCQNIYFQGIKKPYTNDKGYKITPIATDPTQKEIDDAINSANTTSPLGKGLNGTAFCLGEDLVVKKYIPKSQAICYGPEREIKALDSLFENGVKNKQLQEGKYAFATPDGSIYLISSKINGKPVGKDNKLNSDNLRSIFDALQELDKPVLTDKIRKDNFPFKILMHYDLNGNNINLTDKTGGIIDFEWMGIQDLEKYYNQQNMYGRIVDTDCNLGDIPPITSNLRGFEFHTLHEQLMSLDFKEAKRLFSEHLSCKSDYNRKQAKIYEKYASINTECEKIARKYNNHAYLLNLASFENDDRYLDIRKSEAIKIQMTNFINRQSHLQQVISRKINYEQIIEYTNFAQEYFQQRYEKAQLNNDEKRMDYYSDCIELMKAYSGIKGWMSWQNTPPKEKALQLNYKKEDLEKEIKAYEIFKNKFTDTPEITIDEIVCYKDIE